MTPEVPVPVVNASPLIILSRAGKLDLLQMLGERIVIPAEVAEEIRTHSDEAARALDEKNWLEILSPAPLFDTVTAWGLGAGESAVLSWAAFHPGSIAIIDDYAARKCAEVIGIPVKGTLGIALLAKARAEVLSARTLVEDFRQAGLYLSDELIARALALVGE